MNCLNVWLDPPLITAFSQGSITNKYKNTYMDTLQ